MKYKVLQTEYTKSKEWLDKAKEYVKVFHNMCWCCNAYESRGASLQVYHKTPEAQGHENKENVICLCKDCFIAVNRTMFLESDFLLMCHYLKQQMNKNDHNRIFTYSQVKDFKEQYLQDKIKEFKQTLDPELQFDLIQKVLTLPVR